MGRKSETDFPLAVDLTASPSCRNVDAVERGIGAWIEDRAPIGPKTGIAGGFVPYECKGHPIQ